MSTDNQDRNEIARAVIMQLDPSKWWLKNSDHGPMVLQEACGIIPTFIDPEDDDNIKDQMTERYGMVGEWYDDSNFAVHDDGTYEFPEDRPLAPIAKLMSTNPAHLGQYAYVYEYGLVVVKHSDGRFYNTRMD